MYIVASGVKCIPQNGILQFVAVKVTLDSYMWLVISVDYVPSQVALVVKNPPANAGMQEMGVQSLGQEDPLEEHMATTPVFLPGESHGWRNLGGSTVHRVVKNRAQLKWL